MALVSVVDVASGTNNTRNNISSNKDCGGISTTASTTTSATAAHASSSSSSLSTLLQNHHPFAAKTVFPDFGLPDVDSTDGSSICSNSVDEDDSSNNNNNNNNVETEELLLLPPVVISVEQQQRNTKADQDVAVFLGLVERMALPSLIHILQGHVREQQPHNWEHLVAAIQKQQHEQQSSRRSSTRILENNQKKKKQKVFRFAELRGGMVRQVVHPVEEWKYLSKDIWWTDEEMMAMRLRAIATVKHFRKHRPTFLAAVQTILMHSPTAAPDGPLVDQAMKLLVQESGFSRGLETHICVVLSRARSSAIQAVLEEQVECRTCQDSLEVTWQSLAEQSRAYSLASLHFAQRLGQADCVEALKANLLTWRAGDSE